MMIFLVSHRYLSQGYGEKKVSTAKILITASGNFFLKSSIISICVVGFLANEDRHSFRGSCINTSIYSGTYESLICMQAQSDNKITTSHNP